MRFSTKIAWNLHRRCNECSITERLTTSRDKQCERKTPQNQWAWRWRESASQLVRRNASLSMMKFLRIYFRNILQLSDFQFQNHRTLESWTRFLRYHDGREPSEQIEIKNEKFIHAEIKGERKGNLWKLKIFARSSRKFCVSFLLRHFRVAHSTH